MSEKDTGKQINQVQKFNTCLTNYSKYCLKQKYIIKVMQRLP
jgi:hypothetical protein